MVNQSEILNASILIVDDQAANVQLLEQLLSEAGYTCVASTMNPEEVGTLHAKNQYDVILLDLKMPVMDGFQVMENLKRNDADKYLPVIVLTAEPGHKLRALKAGAKDFISKPFDLVEVKTRIHNMLEVRLLYKKLASYNKVLEQTVQERTAKLRESEARFRSLTELASDWYWEQSATGEFTTVSGPVLEILGIRVTAFFGEQTDAEIMDFMVSRYGDFVLYRPPVNPVTWLLWFGPFVLLIGAVVVVVRMVRQSHNNKQPKGLNAAQRAKASALLQDTELPK